MAEDLYVIYCPIVSPTLQLSDPMDLVTVANVLADMSDSDHEHLIFPAESVPSTDELMARASAAGVDPVAYAGEYRAASAAYSRIG
jgi:hypothetical protein